MIPVSPQTQHQNWNQFRTDSIQVGLLLLVNTVVLCVSVCVFLSVSEDCQEQLDFKDMKLQMLLVSLKELTATKEVIQTLEQLLCEESAQLQEERRQVSLLATAFPDV